MKPVRWSDLKWMGQSPAHFKHYRDHPLTPSAPMRIGSHVDSIIYPGQGQAHLLYPERRAGKAWLEFQAEAIATHGEDVEILNEREWAVGQAVADAVMADKQAMEILRDGEAQKRLEWEINGRACHGTPDTVGRGITDLKVTACADPRRFPWHARKMGWNAQVVWYADAQMRIDPTWEPERISLVAVEPKPPYQVVVYDFTEAAIDEGRKLWRSYWERLMVCEENDYWPGYSESFVAFDAMDNEPTTIVVDGEEIEV